MDRKMALSLQRWVELAILASSSPNGNASIDTRYGISATRVLRIQQFSVHIPHLTFDKELCTVSQPLADPPSCRAVVNEDGSKRRRERVPTFYDFHVLNDYYGFNAFNL